MSTTRMEECSSCGRMFASRGDWHTECFQCFISTEKGRQWQEWKAREQARSGAEQQQRNQYQQGSRGYDHASGSYEDLRGNRTSSGSISKDLLRRLIMLCHPDKHGGSALATEVTQQLLKMREECK